MSDFPSLLPPNASDALCATEQTLAERKDGLIAPIGTLWNADTCSVDLLPWLAWSFSVEVWDHAWPERIKRQVIRDAVQVHQVKGTRRSVEIALASLEIRSDLVEWFEDGSDPHTFRLDAFADAIFDAGFQIDPKLHALVTDLIETVKPVRSHFTLRIGEKKGGAVTVRSGSLHRVQDGRHITPALPIDVHSPQLSARSGHLCTASSKQTHRFTMEDAA